MHFTNTFDKLPKEEGDSDQKEFASILYFYTCVGNIVDTNETYYGSKKKPFPSMLTLTKLKSQAEPIKVFAKCHSQLSPSDSPFSGPDNASVAVTRCRNGLRGRLFGEHNLELRDTDGSVEVLALDCLGTSSSLLLDNLEADRLRVGANDGGAAPKQVGADIGLTLQGEVARTDGGGSVQAERVAGENPGHLEGQAYRVARGHEVRLPMNVHRYVVLRLGGEEREEVWDRGECCLRSGRWVGCRLWFRR